MSTQIITMKTQGRVSSAPLSPAQLLVPSDSSKSSRELGIMPYAEALQTIDSIAERAVLLSSQSGQEGLALSTIIDQDMQRLVHSTTLAIEKLSAEQERSSKRLAHVQQQYTEACQALARDTAISEKLEVALVNLQEQQNVLGKDISNLAKEAEQLVDDKDWAETVRTDSITDLIPGVGFFGGLITRRFWRMIPLYSQVIGVISWAEQDKERCQEKLNIKCLRLAELEKTASATSNDIVRYKNLIELTKNEMTRLKSEQERLDNEIKFSGRHLTCFKNIHSAAKSILIKYNFLCLDIEMIKDHISLNILDKGVIFEFLKDLQQLKVGFEEMAQRTSETLFLEPLRKLDPMQKQLRDGLYSIYACLNTMAHTSQDFLSLVNEKLSEKQQYGLHYYIYLVCQQKKYDTRDPNFGRNAIGNSKIPSHLIQRAVLEYAFQSGVINDESPFLKIQE